jgi:hypothetical protein
MLVLVVVTKPLVASCASIHLTTMLPGRPSTFHAHDRQRARGCTLAHQARTSVRLKALPAVAYPCLAKITHGSLEGATAARIGQATLLNKAQTRKEAVDNTTLPPWSIQSQTSRCASRRTHHPLTCTSFYHTQHTWAASAPLDRSSRRHGSSVGWIQTQRPQTSDVTVWPQRWARGEGATRQATGHGFFQLDTHTGIQGSLPWW